MKEDIGRIEIHEEEEGKSMGVKDEGTREKGRD